jgi:hypothetical protein
MTAPWRLFACLLLLTALPAQAAAGEPNPKATVAAWTELQRLDSRVQTIGWRLVHGNAPFCDGKAPAIGLQLTDLAGFPDPADLRRALGLASDIGIAAVAANGPAARARLAAGDAVVGVAGQAVKQLAAAKANDHARLTALHDRIDATLAREGKVTLDVLRASGPERVTVPGVEACATRYEMLTGGERAAADGSRVVVSRKWVEFLAEDDQLAALLAHELAHNVLRHRVRLNAQGRTWGNIRATEREADRLSVWLLANAGYDPAAALRFMAAWGPPNDHGIFSSPDHDRWRTRHRRIAGELARLAAARAAHPQGAADWRRDFVRGEGPGE